MFADLRSRSVGLLTALFLAVPAAAAAQAAPSAAPAAAEPGAELVVGVLTMGQGDQVYERFGHNAIWIHDPVAGTDRVYNYGVFDFDSPGYWGRFARGDWLYMLAVDDLQRTLYAYQYFNRSVELQVLNLTAAQKRELQQFLEWNALPENRDYLYDYYRDNCSTRIRDVLDRTLGGALRAATQGVPTGTTYRWHSDRLIAGDRLSYTGLHIGLAAAADRPIDAWEEMFVPFAVQERIRELQVDDGTGRLVPLVAHEEVLFAAGDREPQLTAPPRRGHWYLLAGLLLAGVILLLGRSAGRSAAARAGLAVIGAGWGMLLGFFGSVLFALWTLTNHSIAHANENLLQMNPLAFGLVVLVPALAIGAAWAARPARLLALALAALSGLGLLLAPLPGFDQHNWVVLAFAVPVHLAFAFAVHRLALKIGADGRGVPAAPARRDAAHAGASRR